jgi:predicted lipid-binding transport protein (Tim44 family)
MRRNRPCSTPACRAAAGHRVRCGVRALRPPSARAHAFPPGFDADAFAREAKLNFIRLQAAFDAGNLDDLRAFTTPEVFAEIRMQLAERGDATQLTDVTTLHADVLEAVDENNQHIVSVRFTGWVRETAGRTPRRSTRCGT